jgi:hypothetical protein
MGLDVTIQDSLYRILTDPILHRAASADAVFSILSLPRHFRGTRKRPALPSPRAEKHGLTHLERFLIHLLRPVCFTAMASCPAGVGNATACCASSSYLPHQNHAPRNSREMRWGLAVQLDEYHSEVGQTGLEEIRVRADFWQNNDCLERDAGQHW